MKRATHHGNPLSPLQAFAHFSQLLLLLVRFHRLRLQMIAVIHEAIEHSQDHTSHGSRQLVCGPYRQKSCKRLQ